MTSRSASELLKPLVEALEAHAQLFDGGASSEEQIEESERRLAEAAEPFSQLLDETTEWLDPFANFRHLAAYVDEHEEEEKGAFVVEGGERRLSLKARFDFVVRDETAFVAYVQRRLAELGHNEAYIDEHAHDSTSAFGELFELDGWDTAQYEDVGLQPAGAGSDWGPTDKTLSEMDFDEREDAGL